MYYEFSHHTLTLTAEEEVAVVALWELDGENHLYWATDKSGTRTKTYIEYIGKAYITEHL